MSDDGNRMLVSVKCELYHEDLADEPYFLRLILTGDFSVVSENAVEFHDLLRVNSVAILFPYLRAIITTVTAASNLPPVILPPINTYKLLTNNDNAPRSDTVE